MDAKVDYEPRPLRIALPRRGGEMAILDFGPEDRPVDIVFSHANGFNARTYRTILSPLAQELRILALDLRGHGATTLPTETIGHEWTVFRDDLLALLEAAVPQPVVLAGHSMGGAASLLAAALSPDRVRRLALFDPVMFAGEAPRRADVADSPLIQQTRRRRTTFPGKPAALEAYLGRGAFKTWKPAQVADYVEAGFRETDDGGVTLSCAPEWEAANFRASRYDVWAAVKASRCPIDIRRAEHGSTCQIDVGEVVRVTGGRIRIRTIAGASHFLPMERPDVVAEALRAAVAGQGPSRL